MAVNWSSCRASAEALKAGDGVTAVELYTQMLEKRGESAGLFFNRSLAYAQIMDHEAAVQDLQQARHYKLPTKHAKCLDFQYQPKSSFQER